MPDFSSDIHEFVACAHFDAERVRSLLDARPELLERRFEPWNETAIEAAAHMGRADILRLLIERGAAPTTCALAALGDTEALRARLADDPRRASEAGAHGLPLLFHAALSGREDVLDAVWTAGGRDGLDVALHAAVSARSAEATRWLLARGARPVAANHEGKTPLAVADERGLSDLRALLSGESESAPA